MEKQFFFFNMSYEQIRHIPGAPYRTVFISIGYVGMHWHKEMELLLVLEGSVTITNSKKTCTLKKGDLFWVNAWEVHSLLETEEENLLLVLQIDPEASALISSGLQDRYYELTPEKSLDKKDAKIISQAMTQIIRDSVTQPPAYSLSCMERIYSILACVSRKTKSWEKNEEKRPYPGFRTKAIVDYLNKNYKNPLSLEKMAAHFNLSSFYLSHLIKKQTGFSFQDHLNFIRLHHAVDLMMTTDLRLIDISLESGFSDPKYLNRYFNLLFGLRPSEMRRKENWKTLIKSRFGQGSMDLEAYGDYLKPYI